MTNNHRVFITGLGALTSSGASTQDTWDAVLAGESSIAEIKQWDLSTWTHKLGGELQDYQPAKLLYDRKLIKSISRQDVLGINAAMQAIEHSNLLNYSATLESPDVFNDETGVFVGSPGNKYYQQYDFLPLLAKTHDCMQSFGTQLFDEVHPMWLLRILPNNVLAYTGMACGFKGVNHNIVNHAVGGMQAIIEAYQAIKQGSAARAVVVAYDVGTEPQALFYYEKLGVLSAQHLKPFDASHDGTIMAEGAAALVLENESSVIERGAVCYAEIISGLSSTESAGLFSIEDSGDKLAVLIQETLNAAELTPDNIGVIIAHGNGNQKSDDSEAQAFLAVFGEQNVPVTAFKWSMGHTICASGIVDTVLATHVLKDKRIPGVVNLDKLSPTCESLNISRATRDMATNKPYAMIINRGFASMNACLVIKAIE